MEREEIVEIIKKCGIYGAQLTRLADSLNAELAKEKDLEWEGPNDCVMCDSRRHFCKERFTGKCKLAAEKPTASGELVEELRGLVKHPKTPITVEDMDDKTWGYINGQKSVYDMFFDRINEILSRYKARKEIVLTEGEMKRDELEALYSLYHGFSRRVNAALKPAVKMWQKSHGQPLTWPDPIALIKWLIKEAK